jgi:1-deoxy-D-xylulose-5-phosphate synthase
LGLKHPIAIRYPRGRGVTNDWEKLHLGKYEKIEIGKAKLIKNGSKVAILSTGTIGNNVTLALDKIQHPENFAHYNFAFVKPLDEKELHTIFNQFETIITIEDGVIKGGFGSAVLEFAATHLYTSKIQLLGIPDVFIEQGSINQLQQYSRISVDSLEIIFSSY